MSSSGKTPPSPFPNASPASAPDQAPGNAPGNAPDNGRYFPEDERSPLEAEDDHSYTDFDLNRELERQLGKAPEREDSPAPAEPDRSAPPPPPLPANGYFPEDERCLGEEEDDHSFTDFDLHPEMDAAAARSASGPTAVPLVGQAEKEPRLPGAGGATVVGGDRSPAGAPAVAVSIPTGAPSAAPAYFPEDERSPLSPEDDYSFTDFDLNHEIEKQLGPAPQEAPSAPAVAAPEAAPEPPIDAAARAEAARNLDALGVEDDCRCVSAPVDVCDDDYGLRMSAPTVPAASASPAALSPVDAAIARTAAAAAPAPDSPDAPGTPGVSGAPGTPGASDSPDAPGTPGASAAVDAVSPPAVPPTAADGMQPPNTPPPAVPLHKTSAQPPASPAPSFPAHSGGGDDEEDEEDDDEDDEADDADRPMTLRDHLNELRKRLFRAFLWVLAGFVICYPVAEEIFALLFAPLTAVLPKGSSLIYTSPPEAFFTYMKVAFVAGIFLTSPMVFYQIWAFIAPGLYKEEKMYVLPVALFSALFFIAGGAFCYFIVFPFAFTFFMSYNQGIIQAMPALSETLSFVLQLLLAFGLIFELPLFVFFLARLGIVTADMMRRFRRYALLCNVIIAAILTPPDVMSQLLMAAPLLLLYEFSILIAAVFGRKKPAPAAEGNETEETPEKG